MGRRPCIGNPLLPLPVGIDAAVINFLTRLLAGCMQGLYRPRFDVFRYSGVTPLLVEGVSPRAGVESQWLQPPRLQS